MYEPVVSSWPVGVLAMYMTLLSSYAANTHPDVDKRKVLQRAFSIGILIFCAMIFWNAFGAEAFLRSIL